MASPPKQRAPGKAKILLLGYLPGRAEEDLDAGLDVVRTPGPADLTDEAVSEAAAFRGMCVGMIPFHGPTIAITETFLKRFPALEIVANFGVGYEHIDAGAAARLGIIVTHTPNVLTEEVADTAMGLLLSTVRQLPQADRYVREGKWLQDHYPLSASLRGRKLGMLGFGRIGKAIARRAQSFGLDISYHTRNPQQDQPYRHYPSLLEMAKAVDILLITVPGGAATQHLVDAKVLEALGPDGILINIGRGTVVDEAALIAALKNRTILSAGLDVFPDEPHVAPELVAMDHIVLFPHIGSGSAHARHGMAQLAADNLLHWFAGKGPITPVSETPYRKP